MKSVLRSVVIMFVFTVFLTGCAGFTELGSPSFLVDTRQLSKEGLAKAESSILQTSRVVSYHREDTILHSESLKVIAMMVGIALYIYIGTRI